MGAPPKDTMRGFTLFELLVTLSIVLIIASMLNPAIQALSGAGSVNKSITDLDQTLQAARAYAMANHTNVRVLFGSLAAGTSGRSSPALVVLSIYPAGGGLDSSTNDTLASMADSTQWPLFAPALISDNLVASSVNASFPNTSSDTDLFTSNSSYIASGPVTRKVANLSPDPTFTACIQINPAGEAEVIEYTPVRYIKMAFDRPSPQNGKDPFILRLYGINGRIDILRKENGIP